MTLTLNLKALTRDEKECLKAIIDLRNKGRESKANYLLESLKSNLEKTCLIPQSSK